MTFLFFQPSMIVPTLLFLLILLVLVAIIGVSINQERKRRRMQREARRMKKMAAAVSNVSLVGEEMQEKEQEIEEVKPVKGKTKKKESGDRTIYDDRKKLNSWQVHLSDTYKAMKKKNPKTTFQAAMKAAKKTYKKAKK